MLTNIYHITKIQNLRSTIEHGKLLAYTEMHHQNIGYNNIAYGDIQARRARTTVPCTPGGVLHDYIPFYFAPRSPMLYTINKGNVADCPEGQSVIAYIVSTAEAVQAASIPFAFTDTHATMQFSSFYNDLANLDKIEWGIMTAKYWFDTNDDLDRKQRRQAEFLVKHEFPLHLVTEIGALDQRMRREVLSIVGNSLFTPKVVIRANWYY